MRWVRSVGKRSHRACVNSAAADLGALPLKIAYERWSDATGGEEFGEVARRTLSELQAASALC